MVTPSLRQNDVATTTWTAVGEWLAGAWRDGAWDNRGVVNYRRHFVPLIVAWLILLPTACARVPVDTMPIGPSLAAIVTWNMNAGVGDLEGLITDLENGILTDGPASEFVVLLQEAVEEDAAHLRRLADARHWSMFLVPVRYDGRRTRSNAILSSRPLLVPRTIPLPQERQARTAAAASIDLGGQRIFIVSAHLENRAAGWKVLTSDTARRRQAEALIQALPADEPGILGGDLNTWLGPGEPALRALSRRFSDTPAVMRTPTFKGRLVLDHLFFDLPDEWRAVVRVVQETYGSDHHPVVAVISGASQSMPRRAVEPSPYNPSRISEVSAPIDSSLPR